MQITTPLPRSLDIGCGTGQSTVALEQISSRIVGTDISWDMLTQTQHSNRYSYVMAHAEQLPFVHATFDLITVGLAFHWFDRSPFLAEVSRVLTPGGWLALYNNVFTAVMRENPSFEQWVHDSYGARYPTPPRHNKPITELDASPHALELLCQEQFTNDVSFSPEELAAYMTTQSNVIAAVEQGTEGIEAVYNWLLASVQPFFVAPRATFVFGNMLWLLRKKGP